MSNYQFIGTYQLEPKELYKVKTPFISIYKDPVHAPFGYTELAADVSVALLNKSGWHWTPGKYVTSFEELFSVYSSTMDWYRENIGLINTIKHKIAELKTYSPTGKESPYFYTSILITILGFYRSLPMDFIQLHDTRAYGLVGYLLDWPDEDLPKLIESFDRCCYDDFTKFIPLAFSAWPDIRNSKDYDGILCFDQYATLLFDTMLDITVLLNKTSVHPQYKANICTFIQCCYKHLKKNKIYLPRSIQEKVCYSV